MYYPYFLTYMSVGIAVSLVILVWALRSGQFSDQQRARFLALEPDPEGFQGESNPRRMVVEFTGLAMLACAGLLASMAVLVFAMLQ